MEYTSIVNNAIRALSNERWSKFSRVFAGLCLVATAFPLTGVSISVPSVYGQQIEAGVLNVEILDFKGNPLPGAIIKIYNLEGQQIVEKATDSKGQVQFAGLKGKYKLEITAEKHETYTEPEIEVVGGMMAKASIQLTEPIGKLEKLLR